jgi:hypothetical protein
MVVKINCKMKQFIVITSIFEPTLAVQKFASLSDYQLVVVGDFKTPKFWNFPNVTFLGVDEQKELNSEFSDLLPYNHYGRKMMGYIFAIQQGADIIIDTDDDNIPYDNWSFPNFEGTFETIGDQQGFYNIYSDFTSQKIWPRGLPLQLINSSKAFKRSSTPSQIGIWQGLADGDPDVDAIYRLVSDIPCTFNKRQPVVLGEGTICPFNSQNTAFRKELFPLLYLPAFVTFRFTDILRGIVAQPIMWKHNYRLGFTEATVFQERNPHNYMRDFESEVPMYLKGELSFELSARIASTNNSVTENLHAIYVELEKHAIVEKKELTLLESWLSHF